jgi:hypothetical protein
MHYTANGKAAADRTRIGIKYASAPPKTEVRVVALANQNFVLKAGAPDTRVDAEVTLNQDITLWSVLPHTPRPRQEVASHGDLSGRPLGHHPRRAEVRFQLAD